MTRFKNPLTELENFKELEKSVSSSMGPLLVHSVTDAAKAHLIDSICKESRPWKSVVTYSEQRARELFDDLHCFSKQVFLYPAKDLLFYSADIRGFEVSASRIEVRRQLQEGTEGIIVTTVDALMDKLEAPDEFLSHVIRVDESTSLDPQTFSEALVKLGYERTKEVRGIGQFSVRGGIIDFFPVTEELPVRIELWDTEIDSIRSFDPENQRSIERLDHIFVYPAREEDKRGKASFLRYLEDKGALLFVDELPRIRERAECVETEWKEGMAGRLASKHVKKEEIFDFFTADETLGALSGERTVCLSGLQANPLKHAIRRTFSLPSGPAASFPGSFDLLIEEMKRYEREKWSVVLLTPSATRAERLANSLREYGISAFSALGEQEDEKEAVRGAVMILKGSLHRGFAYPLLRFALLSEGELFGKKAQDKRKKKKYAEGGRISTLSELSVGDCVVHEDYGFGIYGGIEQIEADGAVRDYIKIQYRDGDNCYVPATKLDVIQKYSSSSGALPKLSRLCGSDWGKTKNRVKKAVRDIAKELVTLYAERLKKRGHVYGPDTVWQREFEEMFPFEETEDQKRAIADVKAEMESGHIMDRLICGDVGYGKTEIALRAAFKAVQEGEQVIFLAPTTILAQQHYNNFVQRMKDFPVRADLLCRFRTAAQQKETLKDFSKGLVDVLIGTHRVLSKDIKPKKLGMLIVDEEQRFGVTHKEKLKQLKKDVNVLTLTATPIPRTLHMSLSGIRELSILTEPPKDRKPIQTYVLEYSEEMVREAIRRELSRGGQVYYIYNRVNTIAETAKKLSLLLPDATIAYAHGQMNERELEQIMLDFMNGEIDVLVSTTIIETGLDISNVNTIVIQDADRFGLSQLYQLRGRVGRSGREAYAFLLYRRGRMMTEEAEKRLKAIREFTELGSGIRIAMRDLEIRGAGNVLGEKQHGHMLSVGYDLYCKLLNRAVRELSGDAVREAHVATVDAEADAYIPKTYIRSEEQKLDIYKRIASVENEEDDLNMQDELMDRFGEIPTSVQNLLLIARIRSAASALKATAVAVEKAHTKITMGKDAPLDAALLPDFVRGYAGRLYVRPGEEVCFVLMHREAENNPPERLRDTLSLLEKMKKLVG